MHILIMYEIVIFPTQAVMVALLLYFMSGIFNCPIEYKNKGTLLKILLISLVYKGIIMLLVPFGRVSGLSAWIIGIPSLRLFLEKYSNGLLFFSLLLILFLMNWFFFRNFPKKEKFNGSILGSIVLYSSELLWKLMPELGSLSMLVEHSVNMDKPVNSILDLSRVLTMLQSPSIESETNLPYYGIELLLTQYYLIPFIFLAVLVIILSLFNPFLNRLIKSNRYYKFNVFLLSLIGILTITMFEPIKRYLLHLINRIVN